MLNYRNTNIVFIILITSLLLIGFYVKVSWWWFLLLFAIRFVVLIIGSSFIQLNFHLKSLCNNAQEKEQIIAITFDDGPNEYTVSILDLLKKHEVKATFFCIGKNIEKHPEILKRVISEGHIVGNHSYSHSHFFDFYRKKRIIEEIKKTDDLIAAISGGKPQLFRPPYGVTNPSIRRAIMVTNHKVIGWNIRSLDGIVKNKKMILNRVIKRIAPGGIILLHDTSLQSVKVLEQLLLILDKNKYKVVSLEKLLKIKAYED